MSKIIAFTSVTLDGVMQAPGRPDEDTRGGFEHGGWATPYSDEAMGKISTESMAGTGALLFGRRTYEDFYAFWPNQTDNPYTDVLNGSKKYVASRSLDEPLPWQNSALLEGDAADAVAKLKEEPGKDIVILGSGELGPLADAARAHRPVRAAGPPARPGHRPATVHGRRIGCQVAPDRHEDHAQGRCHRHLRDFGLVDQSKYQRTRFIGLPGGEISTMTLSESDGRLHVDTM